MMNKTAVAEIGNVVFICIFSTRYLGKLLIEMGLESEAKYVLTILCVVPKLSLFLNAHARNT